MNNFLAENVMLHEANSKVQRDLRPDCEFCEFYNKIFAVDIHRAVERCTCSARKTSFPSLHEASCLSHQSRVFCVDNKPCNHITKTRLPWRSSNFASLTMMVLLRVKNFLPKKPLRALFSCSLSLLFSVMLLQALTKGKLTRFQFNEELISCDGYTVHSCFSRCCLPC